MSFFWHAPPCVTSKARLLSLGSFVSSFLLFLCPFCFVCFFVLFVSPSCSYVSFVSAQLSKVVNFTNIFNVGCAEEISWVSFCGLFALSLFLLLLLLLADLFHTLKHRTDWKCFSIASHILQSDSCETFLSICHSF